VRLGSRAGPWIIAVAVLPLNAGANGPEDGGDRPPAEDGGEPPQPEDGDDRPPQIVETVPAAGDQRVSILIEPTVYFDRAVDPAAVDPGSLRLVGPEATAVDGRVVLGAGERSVAFMPARPLDYGREYALEVAVGGEEEVVVFATFANPPQRHLFFWGSYLQGYRQYEVDELGRILEVSVVVGPGFDGEWFTGDDRISALDRRSYDPGGRLQSVSHFIDPGPDGVWRTADDILDWRRVWIADAPGRVVQIEYVGPGDDGQWLVEDDRIGELRVIRHDARGRPIEQRVFGHPGGDGVWFTEDDALAYILVHEYAGDALVAWRRVAGPGSDGDWDAGDQQLLYRARRTLDAAGNRELTVVHVYAGGDGRWGTDDDVIGHVIDADLAPDGRLERRVVHGGPGFDGEWFTPDDTVLGYVTYEYDPRELQTGIVAFDHPGNDGAWFTQDDVAAALSATDFDPLGNRIVGLVLSDAGLTDWVQFTDRPPYTAVEVRDAGY
jgi:hypothetical protein